MILIPTFEKKKKRKIDDDCITTVNLSKAQILKLAKVEPSLNALDYIELEEFMENI